MHPEVVSSQKQQFWAQQHRKNKPPELDAVQKPDD